MNNPNYFNADYTLGVVPIAAAGGKLGVDAIVGVATSLLPGIFKNKYQESQQVIDQVNQLEQGNANGLNEIKQLTSQIESAYVQTIARVKAKTAELRNVESIKSDGSIKTIVAVTGAIVIGAIAADRLL